MFATKKLIRLLEEAIRLLRTRAETTVVLKDEISRLQKQNQQLLDRVMSIDYEKYQTYKMSDVTHTVAPIYWGNEEELAGEITDAIGKKE